MSVSLYWKPADPSYGHNFPGTSSDLGKLEEVFGKFPVTLTEKDIPKLEGMEPYYRGARELIDALYNNEAGIVLEARW